MHALGGKEAIEYDNPYDVGMTGLIGFSSGYAPWRLRHAADAGHRFPVSAVLSGASEDRAGESAARTWGGVRSSISGWSATWARRSRRCCPSCKAQTDRAYLERASRTIAMRARDSTNSPTGHPGRKPIHPQFLAAHDQRACRGRRGVHLRCRHADGLGGALSRDERQAPADRLVQWHGSMANAMPQAIGAQAAFPGRQVISFSGDGGFTMLMGDFITLVQQGLPVKVVSSTTARWGSLSWR